MLYIDISLHSTFRQVVCLFLAAVLLLGLLPASSVYATPEERPITQEPDVSPEAQQLAELHRLDPQLVQEMLQSGIPEDLINKVTAAGYVSEKQSPEQKETEEQPSRVFPPVTYSQPVVNSNTRKVVLLSADYVPGEVIVRFVSDNKTSFDGARAISKADLNAILDSYQVDNVSPFLKEAGDYSEQSRLLMADVYVIFFSESSRNATRNSERMRRLLGELLKRPDVIYAHPNYIFPVPFLIKTNAQFITPSTRQSSAISYTPSDPDFDKQWGLWQSDRGIDDQNSIWAPQTWQYTAGSLTTSIAVLDTGLNTSHEEFAGAGKIVAPRNTVDDTNDATSIAGQGHGTHVAGIAAAASNNRGGVGLSYDSAVMPINVFRIIDVSENKVGASDSDIADGILWATDHNASVINMSLGRMLRSAPSCNEVDIKDVVPNVVTDAMDQANAAGIASVVSSGNCGSAFAAENDPACHCDDNDPSTTDWYVNTPGFPGAYDNAFTVGATNQEGERVHFSNYGNYIDVVAPGVEIYSTFIGSNSAYEELSGTSMAAPFVSGIAALVKAFVPKASVDFVRSLIQDNAYNEGQTGTWNEETGHGLVNAAAVVERLSVPQPVLQSPQGSLTMSPAEFRWRIPPEYRSDTATQYYLQISTDPNFASGENHEIVETCSALGPCASEDFVWSPTQPYAQNTRYYWRVRTRLIPKGGSVGIGRESAWSTTKNFIISANATGAVDVALIIDSSGSMTSNDPQNLRKEAAKVFIDAMNEQDQVAVIDFDSSTRVAWSLQQVGSDRSGAKAAVDTINSSGGTNIGAGLQTGFNQLDSSVLSNPKAAVLLTDGQGSYSNQAAQYTDKGWKVFTIGLGNGVDENLLRQIAQDTGGEYFPLTDPNQLIDVYFKINTSATGGTVIRKETVPLQPNATEKISLNIPSGQILANFLTTWQGSTVDTTLIDPNGTVITPSVALQNPDIAHTKGATFELYQVQNPKPGSWEIEIFGADLPANGENVTVQAAVRGLEGPFSTYINAPSQVTCDNLQWTAEAWTVNDTNTDFVTGTATIHIPIGVSLALGQSATQPASQVLQGEQKKTDWMLLADNVPVTTTLSYSVTTVFVQGPTIPLTATADILIPQCVQTPHTVAVTGNPGALSADGTSSSTITATVLDSLGNPIPSQTVTFSTTLGTITGPATTDVNGVTTATLTAGTTVGTASVTASAGAANGSATVEFVSGPPADITVMAVPNSLTADGMSTSTVTATVVDAFDNLVPNQTVTFSTTLGTITDPAMTDVNGVTTATLTAGTAVGTATVNASVGATNDNTTVEFVAGPPVSISATANPTNLIADGSSTSIITAMVKDAFSNPVPEHTVTFSTTLGTVTASATTNANGTVTATLTAATTTGSAVITASTESIHANTTVVLTAKPLTSVSIMGPTIGEAGQTITFTAMADNSFARTIEDAATAVPLTYTWEATGHPSGTSVTTALSSTTTYRWTSVGKKEISVTASGSNGSISATHSIDINPSAPAEVTVIASHVSIVADGSSTSSITATIKDDFGNPIAGATVSFSTTLGTVTGSAITDLTGMVTAALTAGTTPGMATIAVQVGTVSGITQVEFTLATLTSDLNTNWNLWSLPINPAQPQIAQALAALAGKYDLVLSFEQGALTFDPSLPEFSNLRVIDGIHAFWIRLTENGTLEVTGQVLPLNTAIALEQGWNLVSYLPQHSLPVVDALASIAGKYDKVLGFDQGAISFYTSVPLQLNTLQIMERGKGYWIHMLEAGTLDYSQAPANIVRNVTGINQPQQAIGIAATNEWINVYSTNSTYNDQPLNVGTTISAIGEDGRLLGQVIVQDQGWYGVLAVYGDDGYTPALDGAQSGEHIRFLVDGQLATITNGVDPVWTTNGDLFQVDLAATGPSLDNRLYLPGIAR